MNRRILAIPALVAASISHATAAGDRDLLKRIAAELRKQPGEHTAWELTEGNSLPADGFWLSPTDDRTQGDRLAHDIEYLIRRAQHTVDIATMASIPDGLFASEIRRGLEALAKSGRPVTVRILIGNNSPTKMPDTRAFLRYLAPAVKGSPIKVLAGAVMTCGSACKGGLAISLNHAKIVSIDGNEAIVGGHNLWNADYVTPTPIYDLTMHLVGPAAQAAENFLAPMWHYVCTYSHHNAAGWSTYADTYSGTTDTMSSVCSYYPLSEKTPAGSGTIPALAVGRYGVGLMAVDPEIQWSDLVMQRVLESAQKTIRLSQQDLVSRLGNVNSYVLLPMAQLIQRGGDVYVVMTDPRATSSGGAGYGEGMTPLQTAAKIRTYVATVMNKNPGDPAVRAAVCSHLHLGAVARFEGTTATNEWKDRRILGNHAKMYMADDHVFYIGSHNVYPMTLLEGAKDLLASNQEFGYVVDDQAAAQDLLTRYWNPLWAPAEKLAVSGDMGSCKLP